MDLRKSVFIICIGLVSFSGIAQVKETSVDVGGYQLHFTIIPGSGDPILFESGGGNDGTIWKNIAPTIADITEATVICYDRAGLGKSTIDSTQLSLDSEIKGLEKALNKLGYPKDLMLVSHSLGGFYNTYYASRHPHEVRAIVFIDVNLPGFFTEDQFSRMGASQSFRNTVETVRNNPLPSHIPVIDIVSGRTLFVGTLDADRWKACHAEFVAGSPNWKGIVADETGHYVFLSNRQLVINAIVTMYAKYVNPAQRSDILERAYAQALTASNDDRRALIQYQHSESDLNEWGYALLKQNELEKALNVFKLNVLLHPESASVYDSLGDGFQAIGNKESAILNYKKALALNPGQESSRKALEKLTQ